MSIPGTNKFFIDSAMKKKILDWVFKLSIVYLIAFIAYWVIQITVACSFHTPTSSMTPTIMPDESALINKLKMGARIFNVYDAVKGRQVEIKRLPGYGKLERGDVIVFNYPYLNTDKRRDSIAMNLTTYYCKRAVAIGGDTLEIKDGFYHVRGCSDTLGVAAEQQYLKEYVTDRISNNFADKDAIKWLRCHPKDSVFDWTIYNMGPLLIPKAGSKIDIDYRHWVLYRKYIEWETGNKLLWHDSIAVCNENPIKSYTFVENYCFAAGDHVIDSKDSRYFGLVPEKFIVGTAGIIWKPSELNRIFKPINRR